MVWLRIVCAVFIVAAASVVNPATAGVPDASLEPGKLKRLFQQAYGGTIVYDENDPKLPFCFYWRGSRCCLASYSDPTPPSRDPYFPGLPNRPATHYLVILRQHTGAWVPVARSVQPWDSLTSGTEPKVDDGVVLWCGSRPHVSSEKALVAYDIRTQQFFALHIRVGAMHVGIDRQWYDRQPPPSVRRVIQNHVKAAGRFLW